MANKKRRADPVSPPFLAAGKFFLKKAAKFLPVWHRYLVKHPLKWNM
ncbi:hypothetical protein M493_12385 [Geobacillus genomosp. 3]|uniref:Uncharacterized protein n=1 Tax=Geobacillus genomosp. 3 TaxID=1921421 RepID=S5Z141_GEOG3|nr:hypothetical protein M493_12385 [Geobacillus genomosp. 3]